MPVPDETEEDDTPDRETYALIDLTAKSLALVGKYELAKRVYIETSAPTSHAAVVAKLYELLAEAKKA